MLKGALKSVLKGLFPSACLGCKTVGKALCKNCHQHIKGLAYQRCYRCGNPSPQGETCQEHLRENPTLLDGLLVGAHFSGNPLLRKAIHQLKYSSYPQEIAHEVFPLMSKLLNNLKVTNAVLQAVPLHPRRFKQRGFNQAEVLTTLLLKQCTHAQKAPPNLLKRQKETLSQTNKSRQERFNSLQEAFQVNAKISKIPSRVLLIDDVATTGATLEACSKVLKQAGVQEVWGLVLARND